MPKIQENGECIMTSYKKICDLRLAAGATQSTVSGCSSLQRLLHWQGAGSGACSFVSERSGHCWNPLTTIVHYVLWFTDLTSQVVGVSTESANYGSSRGVRTSTIRMAEREDRSQTSSADELVHACSSRLLLTAPGAARRMHGGNECSRLPAGRRQRAGGLGTMTTRPGRCA